MIGIQLTENVLEPISENAKNDVRKHLGEEAFVAWGNIIHSYKSGKVPSFDFSEILFDKNKPIVDQQIIKKQI